MSESADRAIDTFVNTTSKGTIALIVPLYGYWDDIPDNSLLKEHVLSLVMTRAYSNVHQVVLIFVADPKSIENDPSDPRSVGNILVSHSKAGNVKNIPVERTATYPEYVAAGMEYAINETKAQFFVVLNPWVMIQHGALDAIVDRANRGDEAKVISGYDVRAKIAPDQFETFSDGGLREEWDVSFDFLCIPRFAAEMYQWNPVFKTHDFLAFDLAQTMKHQGFAAISYPQAPIFPFDFPWGVYEPNDLEHADQATFTEKWGFGIAR